MITLDELRGGVDRRCGNVRFSLELGGVPGPDAAGLTLYAQYDGVMGPVARGSNTSMPTGPLGLGWSMPFDRIHAIHPAGASIADPSFVLTTSEGRVLRLRATSVRGDRIYYITDPYEYWLISHDVRADRWDVVREDGRRWIYGEADSGRCTVETGVHWAGWAGGSAASTGQQSYPVAWNLSRVIDRHGGTYTWTYRQVTETVGTGNLPYTQAAYLESIVGPAGDRALFTFAPKTSDEYGCPDTCPAPPDAWQYRVEKEYLASIELRTPLDSRQTVELDYTDGSGNPVFLGTGETTKRLLMGASWRHTGEDGRPVPAAIPPTRFSYVMDPSDAAYGSVASVVTAEGGVSSYTYSRATLPLCTRDRQIGPPAVGGGVTCSKPRFWFARDYVVVAWLRSDTKAEIVAYTWEGRWVESRPGTVALTDATAYDAMQVATADGGFAVVAGGQCLPCAYAPASVGFLAGTPALLRLTAGEPADVAVGDGFAAVLGTLSGYLNRIRWTGSEWAVDSVDLGMGAARLRCALDATSACAVSCWTSETTANDPVHVRVDRLSGTLTWETRTTTMPREVATVTGVEVHAGDGYVVIGTRSSAAGLVTAGYRALRWDRDHTTLAVDALATVTATSVPAPRVAGCTVAVGTQLLRYTGQGWTSYDVGPATVIDVGVDQAWTVSGAGAQAAYTAYVFDADALAWTAPAALSGLTPGAGAWAAATARSGADGSRWLLAPATAPTANALWYEAPDKNWHPVARIAETLTAAELPSVQLLGNAYCVYQAEGDTHVRLLTDGSAAAAPVLTGERILIPGRPPTDLVGPSSFVTYTGTFGDRDSTLRLRRPIRGDVDGALTVAALDSITQTNGYQGVAGANGTCTVTAGFDADLATVDRSGWRAAYNRTELAEDVQGTSRPLGVAVASYFNGLTGSELTVAGNTLSPPPPADQDPAVGASPGLYHSACYYTGGIDSDGTTVCSVSIGWGQLSLTAGQYTVRVPRHTTLRQSIDGVTRTDSTTWKTATGLPSREQCTTYDSAGEPQTTAREYRYFGDQYGHPELNLLDAVVQVTTTDTQGNAVAQAITTWSDDWGGSCDGWAPRGHYMATTPRPSAFNRWNGEDVPIADGWLLSDEVTARSVNGAATRTVDARGTVSSVVVDASGRVPVATFTNADVSALEAHHFGFEPYESPGPWSYAGGTLRTLVVGDDGHTGRHCLRVPPADGSPARGPVAHFAGGAKRFVFSCWMRVPTGSNANPSNACWQVFLDTATRPSQTLPFPAAGAGWTYVSAEMDLTQTPASQVTLLGLNTSNTEVYVDELCFSPQSSDYEVAVFDASARRLRAMLGPNGWSCAHVLDPVGRTTVRIGPDGAVETMLGAAFSRAMSDGDFDPCLPNSVSALTSAGTGRWIPFGRDDATAWTLPTGWQVGDWRLRCTAPSTQSVPPFDGPAVLDGPALGNVAVHARFERGRTLRGAGIGLDNVIVHWDESEQGWVLGYRDSGGQWRSATLRKAPFATDWMFAVVDGLVLFWGDGNPIFAYPLTQAVPSGNINLFAADPCAFGDLAVMDDPRLSMVCGDGAGQSVQQLDFLDGTTVVVRGSLTDGLGRVYAERNPVRVSVSIPSPPPLPALPTPEQGRVNADATTYLVDEGATGVRDSGPLTIPRYLALDPPPYAQTAYDSSPIGRVTRTAPAGTRLAGTHATRFGWAAHTADDAMAGLGYDAQAGQYQVQTTVDPNGVTRHRLLNALGHLLAERVLMSGSGTTARYLTTQHFYDSTGRLVRTLLPNAFATSPADQAWAVTRTYTYLGQPASVTDPNSGTTRFNYDELGRLRYRLDANGAAGTPPRIVYYRYDDLDRIIEEGTIQSAAVEFASIPQYAPYTLPPGVTPAWTRRAAWDRNPADPAEPHLAGRLRETRTANPGGEDDAESYRYDVRGNVISQRTTVAGYDAKTYESSYAYDTTGALVAVTYPRALGDDGNPIGTPLTVRRRYDRLGRLTSIGTASDDNYARFDYDELSRLAATSYDNAAGAPIRRSYQYAPASMLVTEIHGACHAESLTYTSGGYGGAGYFDGRIASASNTVSRRCGADPFESAPGADSTWSYAYDPAGRLVTAQNGSGGADASLDIGTAAPISYDPNGNLLEVPHINGSEAYEYAAHTNRLIGRSHTTAIAEDFSGPSAPGWTWGASNAGPSASGIVASGVGDGKALELTGGAAGHVEQLALRTHLDPSGSYQLTYSAKADQGFAEQAGMAGWYLQLFTAVGEEVRVPISDVSAAGTSWQHIGPVALDIGALRTDSGLGSPVVAAGLMLVNGKRSGSGAAGPSLYVTDISLTGSGRVAFTYDAQGNLAAAPQAGISAASYDPVTNRTAALTLTGTEATGVAYRYGPSGRRSLESVTYSTGSPDKTLYLRDPSGQVLMRRADAGGVERATSYLNGVDGVFAEISDNSVAYLLRDHLGSTRAVVVGGTAGKSARHLEYGPFGELLNAEPGTPPYRYAGYDDDGAAGRLDLGARLYDPHLRRFLQADPLSADTAGYAYAAGDPIGCVDPDGSLPIPLAVRVMLWSTVLDVATNYVVDWLTTGYLGNASDVLTQAGESLVGSAAYAAGFWAGHALALAASYSVANRGSTVLGAMVVGGAGIAADAARRALRAQLGHADAWTDFGWTSAGRSAVDAWVNFVALGGGFPRVFPSNTAFAGAFVGWWTGGPCGLWPPGGVPVPAKESGPHKAPGKGSGNTMQPIGKYWGDHHQGLRIVDHVTPDHCPPNKLRPLSGQMYFPHDESSWKTTKKNPRTQAVVMRQTTVAPAGFDMHGHPGAVIQHNTDSLRSWRLYVGTDLLRRTLLGDTWLGTTGQVVLFAGLAAWYRYTNYWLYAGWWPVYQRWLG